MYKIKGDIDLILYDDVIIKHNILYKKEIADNDIEIFLKENYKYEVYNKLLKYINKKIRSKKEITNFLNKYELSLEDKKFIDEKLKLLGLNDDIVFLESFIYDKFNFTNYGPYKIKKELLEHNINEELIDQKIREISSNDVYEKLTKLVLKKIKLNHRYSKNEFVRKTTIDLINLGYDKQMIEDIINKQYTTNNDLNLLEKEYDKLFKKYLKKYSNDKLIYIIKQKLYLKGFNVDDINEIISKKTTN